MTQAPRGYQIRTRDITVGVWIAFLVLLSIDSAIFHWLPSIFTGARLPIICFLIMFPSYSAYRVTGIPELLVTFFSTLFVSIQLISSYFGNDSPFIPPETYDNALYKIIANMIFISIMIPWLWFAHRRFENQIVKKILVFSSAIIYPIAMLTQFNRDWADFFYLTAIVFLSFWLIVSSFQSNLLYSSKRNKIANSLILVAFLILGSTFLVLALVRNSTTLTMASLGMDIWIYILYIIIALFSEGFILTESQTISAVHTYSQIKAKEEEECIVFANIDLYLKNIPEDLIRSIDDDDLTLIWIGLQRTTS